MSITYEVAKFALSDNKNHWTADDRALAQVALQDFLGVAVAGSREHSTTGLCEIAAEVGGVPNCTVYGVSQKVNVFQAALINGTSAHIYDFDDVHVSKPIHIVSAVCAAAMAVGESIHASGEQVITAILNGMQVTIAVSTAVYPEHYKAGWHGTSTMGIFGAVAAAGYLLKLTPEQLCCAFGIAASSFGGVHPNFGTMTKAYHCGHAGSQGARAAMMAKHGFTANENIFETGFFSTISSRVDNSTIVPSLTDHHAVQDVRFKAFPCAIPTHAAIRGILELKNQYQISAEDIEEITQEINGFSISTVGTHDPVTALGGKFSSPYCMAVAFVENKIDLASFSEEAYHNPKANALRAKIQMVVNNEFNGTRNGRTTIKCKNGKIYQTTISIYGPEYDLKARDKQVSEKFATYAGLVLSPEKVEKANMQLHNMDGLSDICQMTANLV